MSWVILTLQTLVTLGLALSAYNCGYSSGLKVGMETGMGLGRLIDQKIAELTKGGK